MNDQSIKHDAGKPRLSLVPPQIIREIARVRAYGIWKYGSVEAWRNVEAERYRDAMFRHLLAYIADPSGVDKESGLPHLSHLACNVAFLCEMELGGSRDGQNGRYGAFAGRGREKYRPIIGRLKMALEGLQKVLRKTWR